MDKTSQLEAMLRVLRAIYDDVGDKTRPNDACPVCNTYTHKHWCWYPFLRMSLNLELDDRDMRHVQKCEEGG